MSDTSCDLSIRQGNTIVLVKMHCRQVGAHLQQSHQFPMFRFSKNPRAIAMAASPSSINRVMTIIPPGVSKNQFSCLGSTFVTKKSAKSGDLRISCGVPKN